MVVSAASMAQWPCPSSCLPSRCARVLTGGGICDGGDKEGEGVVGGGSEGERKRGVRGRERKEESDL